MTVIAAYTNGTTVWMSSDNQCDLEGAIIPLARPKAMRIKVGLDTHCLLGFCGNGWTTSNLPHALNLDCAPDHDDVDDLDAWATTLANAINDIASDRPGVAEKDDDRLDAIGLLGYAGHLWFLGHDAAHRINSAYCAIGSGGDLALGALHALYDHKALTGEPPDPEQALRIACAAAAKWDTGCGAPFTVQSVDAIRIPARTRRRTRR